MNKSIASCLALAAFGLVYSHTAQAQPIAVLNTTAYTTITNWGLTPEGSQRAALVFRTGASGPFTLTDLKLNLMSEANISYDFAASLRAVDGSNLPTGSNLATAFFYTGELVAGTPTLLDFTSLGLLGNYSLAASTSYALVLTNLETASTFRWVAGSGSPVTSNGFTLVTPAALSTDGGSSWDSTSMGPYTFHMSISTTGSGSIPEPSILGLFGTGLGAMAFARRRRAKA